MTKLLTTMKRKQRQTVINRLKQEARYRENLAQELADGDQELLQTLRQWMFGPAAYAIEDIHRGVRDEQMRSEPK